MTPSKVVTSMLSGALTLAVGIGVHKKSYPKTLKEKFLNMGYIPLEDGDMEWEELWNNYQSTKANTPRIVGFEFFSSLNQNRSSLIEKCNDLLDTSVYDEDIQSKESNIRDWCLKGSRYTHESKSKRLSRSP